MADGRIVIDVSIDTAQFINDLDDLKKAAEGKSKKIGDAISDGIDSGADRIAGAGVRAGKEAGEGLEKYIGKGATEAESKLGGLKSALGKIGSIIGIAAVGKKLFDLGKEAIDLGSDVAEVQNVVDTAFGDMAYKIEEFSDSAIDHFGMSTLSAKRTASTYMAMAKGMGIADDAASDMAIALTGLTGDVASFYNITQEEADTKLKSVFTGESESLKSLGVVMTQTNLDAYAMANGFGKTTRSMTQAELVALRYQYVTDQLSLAQGDFADTSRGWANQTRILSENWKEFISIMGQGLIQALTPALQMLNQLMGSLISFANGFNALMSKIFGTTNTQIQSQKKQTDAISSSASAEQNLADATKEATDAAKKQNASFDEMNILASNENGTSTVTNNGVSSALSLAGTVTPPDTSTVEQATGKIQNLFEGLKNYIQTNFLPTFTSWGGAFESIKEPVSNAFLSMGASISNLWENTLKPAGSYLLDTWIPDITNTFSETFAPIFSDVIGFAFTECADDFEFLCQQIDKYVNDIWIPVMENVRTITTDAMDSIRNMWDESGGELLENLGRLRDGFKETWNNIYDKIIKPVVTRIQEMISWLWDKHLKKLWDNLVQFFASAGNCIMTLWNNVIHPLVDFIVNLLSPAITNVINTIIDVVGTLFAVVSDVISGIIRYFRGLLDYITGIFSGDWKKAWNGIKNMFGGVWDAIWGIFKGVINLIIDALNALWRGLYGAIAGVINGVGSIVKSFGNLLGKDWGFSVPTNPPTIPKLAQGAVIPANRSFLAVLGDQNNGRNLEAPESLIREIVREESGASGTVTINLKIGGRKFGSVVLESLKDIVKQNGSLEFSLC